MFCFFLPRARDTTCSFVGSPGLLNSKYDISVSGDCAAPVACRVLLRVLLRVTL